MPNSGIIGEEWLNQNSQRSYPLFDEASKTDETGSFTLPDSFIVELYFPVHAAVSVDPAMFFIRQIGVYATGFSVTIAYNDGSADPPLVASTNIVRSTHTENQTYAMPGAGDFADASGRITIGDLSAIDLQPIGVFQFAFDDGRLDSDVIRPMIRGVQSIIVVNGNDRSDPIVGDIELVAGANFRLVPVQQAGQNPQIIMSAIDGEGLTEDCTCEDQAVAEPIRTINGLPPDPSGNFTLLGNTCIDIVPIANGLELTNVCSAPCCGCEELEAVNTQVARFGDGVQTLNTFVARLGREVSAMNLTVLGSRLSDDGCVDC